MADDYQLVPVDHDPMGFVPVDHDPFEAAAERTRRAAIHERDPSRPRSGLADYAERMGNQAWGDIQDIAKRPENIVGTGELGAPLMGAMRSVAGASLSDLDREMLMQGAQRRSERIANELPLQAIEPKPAFSLPSREDLAAAAEKKSEKAWREDPANRADADATEALQHETMRRQYVESGEPMPNYMKPGSNDMTYERLSPEARKIFDDFVDRNLPHWKSKGRLPADTSMSLSGYHWEDGKLVPDKYQTVPVDHDPFKK